MAQHQLSAPHLGFVDKRRAVDGSTDVDHSTDVGEVVFTANASGSTTTIVGADATLADGTNVVRVGEEVFLVDSSGDLKELEVLTVTDVSSTTGTTTVTFSPAVDAATASGDELRLAGPDLMKDNKSLDEFLTAHDSSLYSEANLDKMTQNDKVYAVRLIQDNGSL